MKPIRAMEVRRDSCLLLKARGASRGIAPICILLRLGKVCIDRSIETKPPLIYVLKRAKFNTHTFCYAY